MDSLPSKEEVKRIAFGWDLPPGTLTEGIGVVGFD